MEEHLSLDINATPLRVFNAIIFDVTNVERIDRDPKTIRVRRLPEGDVGKGTVIQLLGEGTSISMTAKIVEFTPPFFIRVDFWGMGSNFSAEYAITDLGEQSRLDFISKPLQVTTFMKFANWLNQKCFKRKGTLQHIKDPAESDQDLRV